MSEQPIMVNVTLPLSSLTDRQLAEANFALGKQLLHHLHRLEATVMSQDAGITAALASLDTEITTAFIPLFAQNAALTTALAAAQAATTAAQAQDQTDAAAAAAATAAATQANQDVVDAAASVNDEVTKLQAAVPAPPAPTDGTGGAGTTDGGSTGSTTALPTYTYDGDPSTVDSATWTAVAGTTPQQYTYSGDTAGAPATGDGLGGGQWHVVVPATS